MSDRELLAMVDQEGDYEGWVTTDHLVSSIGIKDGAMGPVSRRMAWMRRFGAVEKRVEKGETKWRLTAVGMRIMRGKLTAAQRRTLENMADDSILYLTEHVSQRYLAAGSVEAILARRQMQYGVDRKRLNMR